MIKDRDRFLSIFLEEDAPAPDPNADPNAQQQMADPNDPNAQPQDPNQMQAPMQDTANTPQTLILPDEDESEKEDSEFEKMFPMEKDGGDPQQDIANFTSYQKLLYFNKFKDLQDFINDINYTVNRAKDNLGYEIDDEKQHKVINGLIRGLKECDEQITFFLINGIANLNLDKTRTIFRAIIRKMNFIIDEYDRVLTQMKRTRDEKRKKQGLPPLDAVKKQ